MHTPLTLTRNFGAAIQTRRSRSHTGPYCQRRSSRTERSLLGCIKRPARGIGVVYPLKESYAQHLRAIAVGQVCVADRAAGGCVGAGSFLQGMLKARHVDVAGRHGDEMPAPPSIGAGDDLLF